MRAPGAGRAPSPRGPARPRPRPSRIRRGRVVGRDAFSGASLRVTAPSSARGPDGDRRDDRLAPPANMMSASPTWIMRSDSPREWPLVRRRSNAHVRSAKIQHDRQLPGQDVRRACRMKKGDISETRPAAGLMHGNDLRESSQADPQVHADPLRRERSPRAPSSPGSRCRPPGSPPGQVRKTTELLHLLRRTADEPKAAAPRGWTVVPTWAAGSIPGPPRRCGRCIRKRQSA